MLMIAVVQVTLENAERLISESGLHATLCATRVFGLIGLSANSTGALQGIRDD